MTTHERLKARFAVFRSDLEETLAVLSDADLDWAPRLGMRTYRGQLLEIADKEREVLKWIETGTWPDDDPPSFDPEAASLDEIRAVLNRLREATYSFIDARSEADLEAKITPPEAWWEALRLPECPLSEILRNVADHEWYHTGQIVVYLWQQGRNPYDW